MLVWQQTQRCNGFVASNYCRYDCSTNYRYANMMNDDKSEISPSTNVGSDHKTAVIEITDLKKLGTQEVLKNISSQL